MLIDFDNIDPKYKLIAGFIIVFGGAGMANIFQDNVGVGVFLLFVTALVSWLYFKSGWGFNKKKPKQYAFLKEEAGFEKYLMKLVACSIQIDSKTTDSEFRYVEKAISKHFSEKKVFRMMKWMRENLEDSVEYRRECQYVAYNFPLPHKVQLMHLLIGVVTADGLLMDKEYELMKDMAKYMKIPFRTFQSILSMFRFVREGEEKKQSYSKKRRASSTSIEQAYAILGIESSVSDKAVKKAYRKLAVLHHPDKVVHMGAEFQKAAKEKFQKILDAYELIKERRGMN